MSKPTEGELRQFASPDCLSVLRYTEEALSLVHKAGSVKVAHEFTQRRVEAALRNGWNASLYKYCGVLLAFRKARPTSS